MRNFVEPEGYDKGSVSEEVPEIVSSYTAPTELGDDLLAPQLEFCGDLYPFRLRCLHSLRMAGSFRMWKMALMWLAGIWNL